MSNVSDHHRNTARKHLEMTIKHATDAIDALDKGLVGWRVTNSTEAAVIACNWADMQITKIAEAIEEQEATNE